MNNTVVVLGNGFDLDLGLKTSYSDFINEIYRNPQDSKKEETNKLIDDIIREYKDAGWVDIEDFLRRYAIRLSEEGIPTDRNIEKEYEKLSNDFHSYMHSDKYIDSSEKYTKESCAYKLLSFSIQNYIKIFSLNYTDLNPIISESKNDENITYIHGVSSYSFEGRLPPAILGIDPIKVNSQFVNMIKAARESYKPGIISALEHAKNVIFFGVGFGITDAPYFKDFFNTVVNEEFGNKRLFVFTKGNGADFYYRVSQMIGGNNLPKFREKEIYLYDTSKDNVFKDFMNDYNKSN